MSGSTDFEEHGARFCHSGLFNLLKPTYHQVEHSQILQADYVAFMCIVWISEKTVTFA